MPNSTTSFSNTSLLAGLNPVQGEAVTFGDGPLLIFAGAGSGKTRVLTHRVAFLIAEHKVKPYQILAVTFTNKAAKEMKERIVNLLGPQSNRIWIGTFHSICVRLLREFGEKIGLPREFVIYDDGDQIALVKDCLHQLDIDDKQFQPRVLLTLISRAKEQLITAGDFRNHYKGYVEEICARVYDLYTEKLAQNNALDFDDILLFAVQMLERNPDVLEKLQNRFAHILVDEYQDVNFVQYRLLHHLADKRRNICCVGDDDQSIYKFRGADVRLILQFERDYPDARIIKLEQNYRSTKLILEAAHGVISNNRSRAPKKLWTENHTGNPLHLYEADNEHDEADYVAREILSWKAGTSSENSTAAARGRRPHLKSQENPLKTRRFSDAAVLYRANSQSRVLEEIFMKYAIPYQIVGGLRFYERKEIKDIIAYLRVIYNPSDTISLRRIINVPHRSIGAQTLATLDKFAEEDLSALGNRQAGRIPLYQALERIADNPSISPLPPRSTRMVAAFTQLIRDFRQISTRESVTALVKAVVERTGYLRDLQNDRTIESQSRLENIGELLSVSAEFDQSLENLMPSHESNQNGEANLTGRQELGDIESTPPFAGSLAAFLEQVSLVSDLDNLNERSDTVKFMTLHSAKGLEFPVVFIIGLEEGLFPHSRTLTSDEELEEERRLCYVGITRAQQELHLVHAFRRTLFGTIQSNPPSRFLREIPNECWSEGAAAIRRKPDPITWESAGGGLPLGQPRGRSEPAADGIEPAFRPGQKVRHPTFGVGVVLKLNGAGEDAEVSVAFPNLGVKKLLLGMAKLEKV